MIIREALQLATGNEAKVTERGQGRKEAGTGGNGEGAALPMNQTANGSRESSARRASHEAFRMMKYLEKVFQGKMKKSKLGRKMVSETKEMRREMERRAALGQKDGGAEDITQSL